jgi:hypothetical protein
MIKKLLADQVLNNFPGDDQTGDGWNEGDTAGTVAPGV